jgi:serine protease Do
VITAVDGTPVERLPALQHLLGPRYAGETVTLSVARGSETRDVPIELVAELLPFAAGFLGVLPERNPLDAQPEGVAIRTVFSDSPAAKAGLQPRDIIDAVGDDAVHTPAELRDLIGRIEPGQSIQLHVLRDSQPQTTAVTLSDIPDTLPDRFPAASIPAPPDPPAEAAPQTGRMTASLPGNEQKFWAYVPDQYHAGFAYGLLVWLHPAGDTMEASMLRNWQQVCNERGVILVAPQAADINSWTAGEAEFVAGVVEHIRSQYSIDPARITVLGLGDGGKLAWHVAFKHRDLFRGIAVASAPLSERPPDNDPDFPQQILTICSQGDPQLPRVTESVDILRQLEFPAASITTPPAEGLPAEAIDQITLWFDALDRI